MDESNVEQALIARLQGDSTLRTLSGGATFPWKVWRHNNVPITPTFPAILVQFVNGPSDHGAGLERNTAMVTVSVYGGLSVAVRASILARIKKLWTVGQSGAMSVADGFIDSLRLEAKGQDIWDEGWGVFFRPDTYVLRYRLKA